MQAERKKDKRKKKKQKKKERGSTADTLPEDHSFQGPLPGITPPTRHPAKPLPKLSIST